MEFLLRNFYHIWGTPCEEINVKLNVERIQLLET